MDEKEKSRKAMHLCFHPKKHAFNFLFDKPETFGKLKGC